MLNLQSHPKNSQTRPQPPAMCTMPPSNTPIVFPSPSPGETGETSGKQRAAAPLHSLGIPSLGGNDKQRPGSAQKDSAGVMSSRHCSPAVTISGPFPLRPPGTAGSCGKRETGREERAGKQQLLPWMSAGLQEGCGKGGSSLQAWGAERLKGCESGKSCSAPAARPCLFLKEALQSPSDPESFKGLCYIRGLKKGFTPRL